MSNNRITLMDWVYECRWIIYVNLFHALMWVALGYDVYRRLKQ